MKQDDFLLFYGKVPLQTIYIFVLIEHESYLMNEAQYMSLFMRKPFFCICKNKDTDQLRGNREADQRLCFHYIDSMIPLLLIYEISSL